MCQFDAFPRSERWVDRVKAQRDRFNPPSSESEKVGLSYLYHPTLAKGLGEKTLKKILDN